jgi:hypothetical protein
MKSKNIGKVMLKLKFWTFFNAILESYLHLTILGNGNWKFLDNFVLYCRIKVVVVSACRNNTY